MKIPFDIKFRPQIESGEYKVETRGGVRVKLLPINSHNARPIIGELELNGKTVYISTDENGSWTEGNGENQFDLFIVTPEPELSEFEERIFKLLRQYKECDIPLTPENIKAEASMLWSDFEKYFFDLYGKEGEGDSALRSFYYRGLAEGKAKALRTHATELTENLAKSGLDKDSIPYHLIEFMCNLYDSQNWKEIEQTAELYATRNKAAAMKDLPRWGKHFCLGKNEHALEFYDNALRNRQGIVIYNGYEIKLSDMLKLPGFKEDESHE